MTPMEKADAYRLPAIVKKSRGVTQTEAYLSELCDRTFLKLWSYANPFKAPGDELCDLIAVLALMYSCFSTGRLVLFVARQPIST